MNALEYEYRDYVKLWEERPNDVVFSMTGFMLRSVAAKISEKNFYILRRNYTITFLLSLNADKARYLVKRIIKSNI